MSKSSFAEPEQSESPVRSKTHHREVTHPGPLPSLTGLRWVAALLVFCLHTRNLGYFNGQARHFADWGFGAGSTGVSFFFLLSGFVLGWSARSDDRPTAFWRRRFARLYPVHLVTACIAVFVMGMGKPWQRGESAPRPLLVAPVVADTRPRQLVARVRGVLLRDLPRVRPAAAARRGPHRDRARSTRAS